MNGQKQDLIICSVHYFYKMYIFFCIYSIFLYGLVLCYFTDMLVKTSALKQRGSDGLDKMYTALYCLTQDNHETTINVFSLPGLQCVQGEGERRSISSRSDHLQPTHLHTRSGPQDTHAYTHARTRTMLITNFHKYLIKCFSNQLMCSVVNRL